MKVTSTREDSWEKFLESVRPRLAIAQIVESVRRKASLTFDFVVLLVVAALTASLGLVEDSQLILAASLFISPMMFPMMATTLGTVTRQWELQKLGVTNGLLGLLLCLSIGFVFGVTASLLQGYKTVNAWPTSLMYSMGTSEALWTGVILALFSGIAVAIGLLGDDSGAIHGVAISAALLPPAVNAGLLWSRSVLLATFPELPDNSRKVWSQNSSLELALLGAISLVLSFLNILFIFLAGNLLLNLKEVASRKKRDTRWRNLREFKPLTKEETQHITLRLGIPPTRELAIHHWTVSSNEPFRLKMNRGMETWSGNMKDSRPRVQDLAHNMLGPKRVLELGRESKSTLMSPTSCDGNDHQVTPNSRFTVVRVSSP